MTSLYKDSVTVIPDANKLFSLFSVNAFVLHYFLVQKLRFVNLLSESTIVISFALFTDKYNVNTIFACCKVTA